MNYIYKKKNASFLLKYIYIYSNNSFKKYYIKT